MICDRVIGESCADPFPIYQDLAETLVRAHPTGTVDRDPTVAHVLGACAGYTSADTDTVVTMMTRLGLPRHACVRISQTVVSMLVFSTAFVVQSACGRVVIVSYRGTEPDSIGNWLGDAEVGTDFSKLSIPGGSEKIRLHAGRQAPRRVPDRDVRAPGY